MDGLCKVYGGGVAEALSMTLAVKQTACTVIVNKHVFFSV